MRLGRTQLIFRALVVLAEAIEASRDGPLKPSFGVRFALMFLYAVGDGERRLFDGFWRNLQDPQDGRNDYGRRYVRPTQGTSYLRGIARSVGIGDSVDLDHELWMARLPAEERRKRRAEEAWLAEHRRRLVEDGWQYEQKDRRRAEAAAAEARSDAAPGRDDHSPPGCSFD